MGHEPIAYLQEYASLSKECFEEKNDQELDKATLVQNNSKPTYAEVLKNDNGKCEKPPRNQLNDNELIQLN